MNQATTHCLILACGNTLRSDDGVGPWLAAWATECYAADPRIGVICRQQWTPELAEDVACAGSVLFLDCAAHREPGSISVIEVKPSNDRQTLATHHVDAPELLRLSHELYGRAPNAALLLTVGAGSLELGEQFSPAVQRVMPLACAQVEEAVHRLLAGGVTRDS